MVSRHGVPGELLSDRGQNLLSNLIREVCNLLGIKKVNTTAYHPQTDGLVENMNKTLRAMIAKHAHRCGTAWDSYLQQLFFAYRVKPHESTGETPFHLLYGRDARLPTESALSQPLSPYQVDTRDYYSELATNLSEAWKTARQNVAVAQKRQKFQYDKKARVPKYKVGDWAMVFMPQETQGKLRKLALPYHGPYRIIELTPNGATVRPVDKPTMEPILVNLDRVTLCYTELPGVSWLGPRATRSYRKTLPWQDYHHPCRPPLPQTRYNLQGRNNPSPEDV